MKNTYRRPLMVFFLIFTLWIFNAQTAFAAETSADIIDQYNETIMHWYDLLLTNILFPLEIISFAICGFRLLFVGFLSAPQELDKVKKQVFLSGAALAIAIILPSLLGWAVDIFQDTGWQPPRYDFFEEELVDG